MARPRGYRLSKSALHDVLELRRITMTEAAGRSGLALSTVSGLAQGDHRASIRTVAALAGGLGCRAETLFPELEFRDLREDGSNITEDAS